MIGDIIGYGLKLVDKLIPDKEEAAKIKSDYVKMIQDGEIEKMIAQSNIIVAEAQSESSLTRLWRPLTMLAFVSIIVNNYILAPYLKSFGLAIPTLEITPFMWHAIDIGLAGYITSRGVEKGIQLWKK